MPPGAADAALEGTDDDAKVLALGQGLVDADYHVQMVGHEADLPYIDHGIVLAYLRHLCVENSLSERGWLEVGPFAVASRGAYNFAKDRAPFGNHHRHFVCTGHGIVVAEHASCLATFAHDVP